MSAPRVSSRISASASFRLRLSRNASPTCQHRVRHISNCTSTPLASATSQAWKSHRTSPLQHSTPSSSSAWLPTFARSRRRFSTTPISQHGHLDAPKPGEERKVTFIDKEGDSHTFEVADGGNLLDIAQDNDLEMEGACGGSCACSTCHVIVDSDHFDAMEEPEDDENDMLDLAFGLTETSRLGCQINMSKELDGLVVRLPKMTRNLQASDFESKKPE